MIGSTVGPYRILERLGGGGMGEVFLAHDERLHRQVAIKVLRDRADGAAAHRRAVREARAAARLNHPHIAGIHDVVESNDTTYIVMEYVPGETLEQRLRAGRPSIDQSVAIAAQVAEALEYAHARGVVHRDIKPGNIQLLPDGGVKLLDLGLAKTLFVASPDRDTAPLDSESSRSGHIKGTPAYMSPEQLLGREPTAATDIYSLGVVLFEMLTGSRPFHGTDLMALAIAVSSQPTPQAKDLNPAVPSELNAIVAKAMSRDIARRHESARELAAALAAFSAARVEATTRVSYLGPSVGQSRRTFIVVFAVLIATLVGGLIWTQLKGRRALAHDLAAPAVISVVVLQQADDPAYDQLARVVRHNLARGLATVAGIRVAAHDAGSSAAYKVGVAVQRLAAGQRLIVRVFDGGNETVPAWERSYSDDIVDAQRRAGPEIAEALRGLQAFRHSLTRAEHDRLARVPTSSREAFLAYVDARRQLERSYIPGNVEASVKLLTHVTTLDPRFVVAHTSLAEAYVTQYNATGDASRLELARASLDRARELDPDEPRVRIVGGMVRFAMGQFDAAERELRTALAKDPQDADAHRQLGRVLTERGRFEEGVRELELAVRLRPDYWATHFTLGYVLFFAGKYEKAIEEFRRVTDLEHDHPGAYQMLGISYQHLGDLPQAVGNYEHAIRLGPSESALSNLGYLYHLAGRYGDAVRAYRKALELQPNSPAMYRNLGDAYGRLGDHRASRDAYATALRLAQESLRVNSRDANAIAMVALCEAKLGRFDDARRHAAEAYALKPADRDVLYKTAVVHALASDVDAAMDYLQRAVASGYQRHLVRDDEDLAVLRKRADFGKLVGSSEAAKREEP